MLDKTIPYSPIYMVRFPAPLPELPRLPEGYSYRCYREGDGETWAKLQTAVGSFEEEKTAYTYFEKEFLSQGELLPARFGVIADAQGRMAAAAAAWERQGQYLFHWLATFPAQQGGGLGRAALCHALHLFPDRSKPVLLHTQTNSHVAIAMYDRCGFRFVKSAVPGNAFAETTALLRGVMPEETLLRMVREAVELPEEIQL